MKITELYRDLHSDLAYIEKELERAVDTAQPDLRKASFHLLKAGGKRIRPVFVLLSGQFGRYDLDKVKNVAVALEFIHMASLVHDDVIDDADVRRGRPTIKSKWDNRVAMYTGDYMFSRALEIVTNLDNPVIHKMLSKAMVDMTLGEIEQIRDLFDWHQNLRHYLRRVKRKTALLIAVSCCLGSVSAEVDAEVAKQLYRFGYYVGMSYQITDDILDFVGTEKELGKPAGSDLRQGNVTLPVLYTLHKENGRDDLVAFLQSSDQREARWREVLDQVRHSGGIEFSQKLSERYLDKALEVLESLPDLKARRSLYEIAGYIGRRKF
ncbi:MAG TPA: heptaprenyl diphosphate synthase component II [Bacillales bacterium]|nr:heptaprenyl diphosphate synthase component II [Bacillales bacterium]